MRKGYRNIFPIEMGVFIDHLTLQGITKIVKTKVSRVLAKIRALRSILLKFDNRIWWLYTIQVSLFSH